MASSNRVITLHETGLPVRHYFPVEDVKTDLLDATPTETVCPFKGQASYWSVRGADGELRDVAWSYPAPIDGMEAIAGRICFYAERTDHFVEGEPLGRPHSPWSRPERSRTAASWVQVPPRPQTTTSTRSGN